MNNTAAKAIRRDLRRALGEEAIGVLDANTNAITHQIIPNQNALQQHVDGLITDVSAHHRRIGELQAHVLPLTRFHAANFWSRLRWLFTGH